VRLSFSTDPLWPGLIWKATASSGPGGSPPVLEEVALVVLVVPVGPLVTVVVAAETAPPPAPPPAPPAPVEVPEPLSTMTTDEQAARREPANVAMRRTRRGSVW
jgi:hypothetical protein